MNALENQIGNVYDAHSLLIAVADNTPEVLAMGASTILARLAAGNIVAATPAQIMALLTGTAESLIYGTSGTYTGDDTENRAIPHGLGVVPYLVFILGNYGAFHFISPVYSATLLHYIHASEGGSYTVTQHTTTNFYIGDATEYRYSGNDNLETYGWVAFGLVA